MEDTYIIGSLEQLRAISDQLRVTILHVLRDQAMTTKQLGDRLELAPAKVHYHVRELERVGLVQLVETREKGGILEKYYQPVARNFSVSSEILLSSPPDEVFSLLSDMLEQSKADFLRSARQSLERKNDLDNVLLRLVQLRATHEEMTALSEQIFALLQPYEDRGNNGDGEVLQGMFMLYPKSNELQREFEMEKATTSAASRIVSSQVVGVLHYSRAELENLVAEGKRLRLWVVGMCVFANDVEPELAELAVEKLTLVGKLNASPAVAEVLEHKRS
ncbi:helix-turn-helix domain-containing protein [Dictyobacter kobayashii]|uniref:HTH arsR-type domain-containing protein n=1 Tax=Dictyobacter kobayashii TaxID=2014872 RepID=A0A402APZ5_9CHLR|nr:helix-turn-helix domain-containing protein [Dictyobacter kobayashii]GCE21233.1 hypothetical protein KDK_50330 [Dictyobacter kobayashii]